MINYLDLSIKEIQSLKREKTVFLMSVSPVEAHGPHLPVGTDILISEELQRRYASALEEEFPSYTLVKLPPLILGADPLPIKGSFTFPAPLLKRTLLCLANDLSQQGFRYLFISDNHGGPRHQLAIESAARRAFKKYNFIIVNPFGLIFRMMIEKEQRLLTETSLEEGALGDHSDCHAGTNETSLMLASFPELVKLRSDIPALSPPKPKKGLIFLSRVLGSFSPELRRDLKHLAVLLPWINQKKDLPYLGNPAGASSENGEKMLRFHVKIAMELFREALAGKPAFIRTLLWKLRILQYLH